MHFNCQPLKAESVTATGEGRRTIKHGNYGGNVVLSPSSIGLVAAATDRYQRSLTATLMRGIVVAIHCPDEIGVVPLSAVQRWSNSIVSLFETIERMPPLNNTLAS
jgi:hypothetical protein